MSKLIGKRVKVVMDMHQYNEQREGYFSFFFKRGTVAFVKGVFGYSADVGDCVVQADDGHLTQFVPVSCLRYTNNKPVVVEDEA